MGAGFIDVPVNDSSVHVDIAELIVHIIVIARIDEPSVRSNPSSAIPSVIIRSAAVPIPVAV
jgi:hypothetical protein